MRDSTASPPFDYSRAAVESPYSIPPAVASGKLTAFVPLPSDLSIPLTNAQLDALFAPARRETFCRELARLNRGGRDV